MRSSFNVGIVVRFESQPNSASTVNQRARSARDGVDTHYKCLQDRGPIFLIYRQQGLDLLSLSKKYATNCSGVSEAKYGSSFDVGDDIGIIVKAHPHDAAEKP